MAVDLGPCHCLVPSDFFVDFVNFGSARHMNRKFVSIGGIPGLDGSARYGNFAEDRIHVQIAKVGLQRKNVQQGESGQL